MTDQHTDNEDNAEVVAFEPPSGRGPDQHDADERSWTSWFGDPEDQTLPSEVVIVDDNDDPERDELEGLEVEPAAEPKPVLPQGDDPFAALAADSKRRAVARRRRSIVVRTAGATSVLGILAAVTAGAVVAFTGPDDTGAAHPPTTVAPPSTSSAAAVAEPVWCEPITTDALVVSSGPGDEFSGVGIILWQQHQWYVERDADAVRAAMTPNAVAAPVESTRDAIAAVPAGTRHCVTLTPAGTDRWSVQIEERRRDGTSARWAQFVTTTVVAGKARITQVITAGGGGQ
ncbi:hypothetical protein ACFVVM_32915 [Nocardia sp. NPDC058176]|uniref:hypothetical protein n=1 Tax=Nocardia sp. NPDC058176 TaxID=3346368 RepID=UPI0036DF4807